MQIVWRVRGQFAVSASPITCKRPTPNSQPTPTASPSPSLFTSLSPSLESTLISFHSLWAMSLGCNFAFWSPLSQQFNLQLLKLCWWAGQRPTFHVIRISYGMQMHAAIIIQIGRAMPRACIPRTSVELRACPPGHTWQLSSKVSLKLDARKQLRTLSFTSAWVGVAVWCFIN